MSVLAIAASGSLGWASLAACRDADPELFFPIAPAGPGLEQITRAKGFCARCLVRGECLGYALKTGQEFGVWGGTTEDERRELRARLAIGGRHGLS